VAQNVESTVSIQLKLAEASPLLADAAGWEAALEIVRALDAAASKVRRAALFKGALVVVTAGANVCLDGAWACRRCAYGTQHPACHCYHLPPAPLTPFARTLKDECNQHLGALLAWINHPANAPLLGTPSAAAPLLSSLRGALAAAAGWGSASIPRQVAQLMLKLTKAAAGGARADSDHADAAADQLAHELLLTADALMQLAASLPRAAGGPAAAAADTVPLYLQVHGIARMALLSVLKCVAARPAALQALKERVVHAVRPAPKQAPGGAGQRPGGSGGAKQQPGWLLTELQVLMSSCSPASSSKSGNGGTNAAAARSPTPQRTPRLSAATPPPTGGPFPSSGKGGRDRGATPEPPQRRRSATPPPSPAPGELPSGRGLAGITPPRQRSGAAAAAGVSGQQRKHAVQVAVSGIQTWGVLAQMLGATMLEDKPAGQALLNVRVDRWVEGREQSRPVGEQTSVSITVTVLPNPPPNPNPKLHLTSAIYLSIPPPNQNRSSYHQPSKPPTPRNSPLPPLTPTPTSPPAAPPRAASGRAAACCCSRCSSP